MTWDRDGAERAETTRILAASCIERNIAQLNQEKKKPVHKGMML